MADLRIVDAPVLLQESITDDVKMPTGGLGNFSVRLGDILWYVITKEQLANKSYVDLSSKGVKDSLDVHIADKANPHKVTKAQVGLGNVDNTADIDKPVSNATKSAIITATNDMATKAYVNQKDNLKADITYVDSKDGDLTTLTTTDKTNLVKAINEVVSVKADKATTLVGYGITDAYTKSEIDTNYGGVKTLYDKNVEAGAGANGWTDLLIETSENVNQRQINDGLESIAQLLSIKNPRNGMRVYVKSYHAGLNKGGGTFVYDSSKSTINDKGMVIDGWVRQTNQVYFEYFGAKACGVTNSTIAMQSAIDYLKSIGGGKVYGLAGTYLASGLTVYSNIHIAGSGINITTIKLADNSNKDLIYGENANSLHGTTSTSGIESFALTDICLDGNMTNNLTDGSGISVFGNKILLQNVFVKNCRMDGIHQEWGYGDAVYGMEGYYNNIRVDTVGRHGVNFDGSNDTVFNNVIVIDASQNEHATADGFYIGKKAHGRYVSIHSWGRSATIKKARHALNLIGSSNDFVTSHFEGAYTANVSISGGDNTISDSCQVYAALNGINIQLVGAAAGNVIKARIGAPVPGTPISVGVLVGKAVGDTPANNIIDCNMINQLAGCVNLTNSGGRNKINITGFMTEGNVIEGGFNSEDHVKAEMTINNTTVKIDTKSQSAWLGIQPNGYLGWTFPFIFSKVPCVTVTPMVLNGATITEPIWVSSINEGAVSIRNTNSVYVELFIRAETI